MEYSPFVDTSALLDCVRLGSHGFFVSARTANARPAASLIVVRDCEGGVPQFLMIERAASMSFAGGAVVFPGGAVDEADRAWAMSLDRTADADDVAARIAAIRETIEETGFVPALETGAMSADQAASLRQALHAGRALADLVTDLALDFDLEGLVPFARWCPRNGVARRRYDTRFYIAVATDHGHVVEADGNETASLGWHSAGEILERASQGLATVIFPSRRNLERLAQFGSVADLLDHARAQPVSLITPWIEARDGVDHLCIPEGMGYPVTSEPLVTVRRS